MHLFRYPTPDQIGTIIRRPQLDHQQLFTTCNAIIDDVRLRGDQAVIDCEERFDHVRLTSLAVSDDEFKAAEQLLPDSLKEAIRLAHHNIHTFHQAQSFHDITVETQPGITCSQRSVPIQSVGLYVPGGTAPLFSTVLMLATPARIAGCPHIILCTPPDAGGHVHPAILYAASIAGVTAVFKAGGVQAIAAMALGTPTIPRVHKIFGPGNQYVMAAKQIVSLDGVAIDMPAGPSEVCVIADDTARPDFIAADLLSQAEHGPDSQVLLITTSPSLLDTVQHQLDHQIAVLPRRDIAARALERSSLVLVDTVSDMVDLANDYAPEHLIIQTANYEQVARRIVNAGSVFLGPYACESAGDYASGTNHTLPTNGHATAYSGVNLDSFCRKITYQHLTPRGVRAIGPAVETMARAEHLDAHANAMTIRMKAVE